MKTLVLSVALLASPAWAGEGATGHDLLPHCAAANQAIARGNKPRPHDELVMQGICLGEIYATTRMLATRGLTCIPNTMTTQALLRSTVAYLSLKPENLELDFVDLVADMQLSMWPCQERNDGLRARQ